MLRSATSTLSCIPDFDKEEKQAGLSRSTYAFEGDPRSDLSAFAVLHPIISVPFSPLERFIAQAFEADATANRSNDYEVGFISKCVNYNLG